MNVIKKTSGSLILKATILISQHKAIAAILQFLPTIFAERAPSKAPTERPVVNLNIFSSIAVQCELWALYVNITTEPNNAQVQPIYLTEDYSNFSACQSYLFNLYTLSVPPSQITSLMSQLIKALCARWLIIILSSFENNCRMTRSKC